jgi:hypothetical protein
LVVCAAPAGARTASQGQVPAPPPPPRPQVTAVRAGAPINVDGLLDEPVWQQAPPFVDFIQSDPVEGASPSERSEVRVAYDEGALYVGARLWDSRPDSLLARLTRRDVAIPADCFSLYLDPYLDRRSGYYFMVNAAGVIYDGTLSNDGNEDASWDGVWSGRAHRDEQGWTCEMRIPYSQVRFNPNERPVWGVNFRRIIQRRNEEVYLAVPPKKEAGFVSRFGDLHGLDGIRPGAHIELVPYATTRGEFLKHEDGDPFRSDPRYVPEGGADLRMGVAGRLTLNATVNPDFGQVEVDPAVVNLSDVESFFEEKRPFFVEGMHNFRFGNEGGNGYWGLNWPEPMFFYSRRIGRAPQVDSPDHDYADVPVATSILGAAKLTGKITPTTNLGTLHALTARETADLQTGPSRWDAEVEPLTYYGATRMLKEFSGRQHGFGLMNTVVARSFTEDRMRNALSSASIMNGFDGWTFLDKDKVWVISGWSAMSHVRGNAERITALQENSRHYMQRPDASHVSVDRDATSLTGFGSRYWLNKQKGNVLMNAAAGFMDPKFDVADMGFHTHSDVFNAHIGSGYRWTDPTKHRKYAEFIGALFSTWDLGGNRAITGTWWEGATEFTNNFSWNYRAGFYDIGVDNRLTRGGPMVGGHPAMEWGTYFDTDSKRARFYELEIGGSTSQSGSYHWVLEPGIEWKPASNVTLSVSPGFERVHEDAQYVGTFDDAVATQTYGRRYVFGELDQRTFYTDLRLNWAFSPRLSLQLFAQPLVSSGDYQRFKELARPGTYDFLVYGDDGVSTFDPATHTADPDGPGGPAAPIAFENPDFNFKSLRGNAVLRWEYMPGSALFLVWTQQRVNEERLGEFRLRRSFDTLLDERPDDIFLAKLTYYFAL